MKSITRYFSSLRSRTVAGISLLTIVAIIMLVTLPAISKLQSEKALLDAMYDRLMDQQKNSQSLLATLQLYQRYQPYRNQMADAIMPIGRKVEFITTIEQTAEESGVSLELNAASYTDIEGSAFSTLPLELVTRGSFADTVEFIARLERLDQYLHVANIMMQGSQTPGPANEEGIASVINTVTTNIQVVSYWQP